MKKVLIICAGLQFGGVERFATNIIKFAPEGEYQLDYLIFEGLGDAYVPEIEEKGGRVITFPSPQQGYRNYIKKLGDLIDQNHYDVVHSHTQFNSGINLWVAKKHGVPVRIAHSHTTAHENAISKKQQLYELLMRKMILKNATVRCSCGVDAGKWMYGNHSFIVIDNGIDTELFAYNEENRCNIRNRYNISNEAFVIGHSGTISKLKNQAFLIQLLPEIRKIKKNAELMMIGTGSKDEQKHLVSLAKDSGMMDYVHFTGAVLNVYEFLSAFDVFAFPSLREGTPLALIEAQANGLPCVISNNIAPDAVLSDLIKQVSLDNPEKWISAIASSNRNHPLKYVDVIKKSGYDARVSYQKLFDLYNGKPFREER